MFAILEEKIMRSKLTNLFCLCSVQQIILSQEKSIQKLNELVRSLREQLSECRNTNGSANSSLSNLTESILELERQQFMED